MDTSRSARKIAVVEDDDGAAATVEGYIRTFAEASGQEFEVIRFCNALDFLMDYKMVYAVVFMDIEMPYKSGMDAAVKLRELDKTVSIVFITNLVQYAQRGYEVDAVSFLVKPVSYYDFSLKFKKALDVYVMNEERGITLNMPSGFCRISTDKLMFVEVIKHRLYYHLVDGVIEMTGVLSGVEKELGAYGFLRCNSCYLVNPKFIVSVKGAQVRVGNETLLISRPRRKTFMAELANWFAGAKN